MRKKGKKREKKKEGKGRRKKKKKKRNMKKKMRGGAFLVADQVGCFQSNAVSTVIADFKHLTIFVSQLGHEIMIPSKACFFLAGFLKA